MLCRVESYTKHMQNVYFLCAFTKLRKVTIGFVMSLCLSARNNSTPNWRILMKIYIQGFSEICRENSSAIKSGKNKGYFHMRAPGTFVISESLEWEKFRT